MSETYDQAPEPPESVVALLYDGSNAPKVTAKGRGKIAEQIYELAQQHGIPMEKDPELTEILSQIPLGDEIPDSLYLAIAEVIAFAYLVSGKRPLGFKEPEPSVDQ